MPPSECWDLQANRRETPGDFLHWYRYERYQVNEHCNKSLHLWGGKRGAGAAASDGARGVLAHPLSNIPERTESLGLLFQVFLEYT